MPALAPHRWCSDSEILATVQAFENRTLPREQWDHAAHLAVGLVYVRRHGAAGALSRAREGIRAYNAATGRTPRERSGYREDVTRYFMDAIAVAVTVSAETNLVTQLQELLASSTTS